MHRFTVSLLAAALAVAPLAVVALAVAPRSAGAQDSSAAAGRRRCPTCAPAPERTARGAARASRAPARRGAPGAPPVPLTAASISLGDVRYDARVDAR